MNVRFGDKETRVQIPALPLSKYEIYKERNLSKFVSLSLKGRKRTYIVIHLSVLKFITNANPIAWLLTRDGHLTKGYWTELMVSGIHSSLFYPLPFSLHWKVLLPLCVGWNHLMLYLLWCGAYTINLLSMNIKISSSITKTKVYWTLFSLQQTHGTVLST